MDEAGKYITIYQRQADGSWKMARDIWNSDAAIPPSA
jgi:ketosteroid isomerase-like protein